MLKYSNIYVKYTNKVNFLESVENSSPAARHPATGSRDPETLINNITKSFNANRSGARELVAEYRDIKYQQALVCQQKSLQIIKKITTIIFASLLLSGCWSNAITGASLIYDRHNIYIKLNDYQLAGKINKEIYKDKVFKCSACALEVTVFNREVLMTGSLPSKNLRNEALQRVKSINGSRVVFNQVAISNNKGDSLYDSWITGNIRSKILADSDIDPHQFKVVTSRQIVYLLGDVRKEQAEKVINFAKNSPGVYRIVNLLRYYKYTREH